MNEKKIVICVEGGCLTGVFVSPEIKPAVARLLDFDNLKEEGLTTEERDDVFKRLTKGLVVIL